MKKVNKIVLIDDSKAVNNINKKMLESMNLADEITVFENPLAAIEELEEHFKANRFELLPNLIFLDIEMPEMSAFDFLKRYSKIKNLEGYDQKPAIVIISDHLLKKDNYADLKRYVHLGVFNHLLKPLDKEDLEDIMTEYEELIG